MVVAGGDGTASEVATGLLDAGLARYVEVAVLPFGTGRDFARSLDLPSDLEKVLERVASRPGRPIDVGCAHYRARAGGEEHAHFLNVASVGLSGAVTDYLDRRARRAKHWGGRLTFFFAALRCLANWRAVPLRVRVDAETVFEGPLELAAVANGGWFGGGMPIAPGARLDDKLFDIVLVESMARRRLIGRVAPRLYQSRHFELEGVLHFQGSEVEVTALRGEDTQAPIEVDGEPLGVTPASFVIHPGALRIRGLVD